MLGGAIVLLTLLGAVAALVISPHDPLNQNSKIRLAHLGSSGHLLGTDGNGRDILSRLVYGSRTALVIALAEAVAQTLETPPAPATSAP